MPERARELRFERRMSDAEALLWNLEKDPHLDSSFANVTILERSPDFERFRRRMDRAVDVIPRLRQRVQAVLGRLAPPEWVDDPEFDLDYHVRRLALPPPGTERQLLDLAALLARDPFERTRPLWMFAVIEGLEGGRAALFQKMHHAIADGEGAIRLSEQFIDVGPEADDPPEPERAQEEQGPPVEETLFSNALEMVSHNARRQLGVAQRAAAGGTSLLANPRRIPELGAEAVETVRSLLRQTAITEPARSPLWTERSLRRRFEVLQVPFDDAKRAAKALDGTLNDFFVSGAAGGAGAYHRAKGAEVDELRITMPVSTRTDGSAGGNMWSPTRFVVPAGNVHPAERFAAVHEVLSTAKTERSINLMQGIAGVINTLPTSVLVRFARQQVETVDFATSNVRAAPFDLWIAGAKILANYPMGPTGGTAFNLTLMSYRGSLDMGLNVDAAAVESPELLRACMQESYAELLAAGS